MNDYTYSKQEYASKRVWDVAIGLQDVDNLQVSSYFLKLVDENISKNYDFDTIIQLLDKQKASYSSRTREADLVSARIAKIISQKSFSFSPSTLLSIHSNLFKDIYEHAGQIRNLNISKKEAILNEKSVYYADYSDIQNNLNFDFDYERRPYPSEQEKILIRIASFTRQIWQTHPFFEGNTRTTAVFMTKYLQSMGYEVDNSPFAHFSRYFRNSLVRSCYSDVKNSISEDLSFLINFYDNFLYNGDHELTNFD